jgi:hypothetical protein
LEVLAASDGFAEWRQRESKDLSNIVQERIEKIQNPTGMKFKSYKSQFTKHSNVIKIIIILF